MKIESANPVAMKILSVVIPLYNSAKIFSELDFVDPEGLWSSTIHSALQIWEESEPVKRNTFYVCLSVRPPVGASPPAGDYKEWKKASSIADRGTLGGETNV